MHDADVGATAKAVADLERITAVGLLALAPRLVAHFRGVDDDWFDTANDQSPGDKNADRAALHCDLAARELVLAHEARNAGDARFELAARQQLASRALHHERALLAMNVQSCHLRHAVLRKFVGV